MNNETTITANMKNKVNSMSKYFLMISRKTRFQCAGIVVLTIVSSFLASVYPVRLGKICTDITDGRIETINDGLLPILIMGSIFLFSECLIILRRIALDCVIASHEADVRRRSIEKMLKMPVSFFSGSMSGERTAQLNQGVSGLSQLIRMYCNDVSAMVLTTVCTLTQVVLNAPWIMAAIMLAYLVTSVLLSLAQIRSQNGIREDIICKKNALDGQICQSIAGLEQIRSMFAESYETDRLTPHINGISKAEKRHHIFMGSFDGIKTICKIAFHIIILLASVMMIANHQMAPGAVLAVYLLFQQMLRPLDDIYRFLDESASSKIKARVLIDMAAMDVDPVYNIADSAQAPVSSGTDIVLHDVSVTNPEKNKILAHYSVTIPGKDIVAIVGSSGCGKTSMIRSLNRYFPHIDGRITILGRDLATYSQKELMKTLCYTPQKAFFFAGTVRENLVYGLQEEIKDESLIDALKKAALFDALYQKAGELSFGDITDESVLAYRIGEGGTGLSGGECQRLSIARAFLRKPEVFIFDESTANLDRDTAEKVLSNVEQYAREIHAGVIYISHDENVVKRCNHVIYLENALKLAS